MQYQYTVDANETFPNRIVDLPRFTEEIRNSSITLALDGVLRIEAGNCIVAFKGTLSEAEVLALETLVKTHTGEPLPAETQKVEVVKASPLIVNAMPPSGLKRNEISINWCDPTTWWYSAVQVVEEVPTTTDQITWSLAHPNVIDVYHGKITGESYIPQYRVEVTVAGVPKVEVDPHHGLGDYTVNYKDGRITFSQAVTDVKVSYWYENGSTWIMSPSMGEVWKLKGAESQFSEDVIMEDSLVYEVWAYDPSNYPNKMMVAAPDVYKTIYDFINDANKAYPLVPAIGGSGWRGAKVRTCIFSWDFQTTTDLMSSYGMELRVRLEHDTPFGGTFATGTFYYIRTSE